MTETGTNALLHSEDIVHASAEFAIVERVVRIVSSVYGAKPDYTRLAAELAQVISFDIFGIVLLQHDRKAVRITVCQPDTNVPLEHTQKRWRAHYHQHPFTDSMLEHLLHATTLVVHDYPHGLDGPPAASGDALSRYPHLRATCIVPLRTKERMLGTLELGSTSPCIYKDSTVQRLIGAVAQVLATAFERTQLEGSAEIQDRQRQALKDVSRALTSTMDLSTILTHITDGVAKALDVASFIVTLDQHEDRIRLAAQSGLDEMVLNTVINERFVLTDTCIIGSTLRHRQSYMSSDIESDERFPGNSALTAVLSMRSVLSYPLLIGNTLYGALLLCSPEPGGFTPLKSDIVALFATQATIAIHNGTLLEVAHQRQRFQHALERLEQGVATHQHTEKEAYAQFARVQEEAQRTFGVSLTSILRFISDTLLTDIGSDGRLLLHEHKGKYTLIKELFSGSNSTISSESSEEGSLFASNTLSLLTQTTQAVLARTGTVSELSTLLMQVQHPTKGIEDAWFVTDLNGTCIYMNPVAEAFCDVRVSDRENTSMSLEQVFVEIQLRIRNSDEVHHYLQDFPSSSLHKQELRCIVALEPLRPRVTESVHKQDLYAENALHRGMHHSGEEQERGGAFPARSMVLENAPSDSHYHLTRHPLHNQHGHINAYALQVRDITTQVRDEKNKAALLSSVSHDLRTPLTTIKAAVTGLLQTDIPWDEQMRREMLEDIDAETDHLTVLVSALVEMSRIEMGALILEKEWCDITEVIYETLIKAKRVLAKRTVKTQFQNALPLLFVDHVQIGRVLFNLIENAARHSLEQAEILIQADSVTDESAPAMVRIQVVDEGCGIPEHEQERIFKSFYGFRSHGSGLGLAICKGIIEAHSGHIWVEPAEKGSCFVFTLPTDVVTTSY